MPQWLWTGAKYCNRVISVDTDAGTAIVEPGIKLDPLNDRLEPTGWMVGPKPSTHVSCTIGGMIGNNSCGSTAQAYGKMVDSVRRLEVLTYDGTRMWVGGSDEDSRTQRGERGGAPTLPGLRDHRRRVRRRHRGPLPRHSAAGVGLQPRFAVAGERV